MMRVKAVSTLSGKTHEMELPITPEQLRRWEQGEFVQDVFPHLTADQREFLMTGITPDEWAAMEAALEEEA